MFLVEINYVITPAVFTDKFIRNSVIDRWKLDFAIIMTGSIWREDRKRLRGGRGDQYLSKTYKYREEANLGELRK